jgi:hypothetical protein
MGTRSSAADVVYRAILRLYPLRFQEDFASDMALDFADASDEAWMQRQWIGLLAVWVRSAADVVRSLTRQWMRTRVPLVAVISALVALSTAAIAQTVVPRGPFLAQVKPNDRDLVILILMAACVVLVIASTIIFTQWFLRPLLYRRTPRKCSRHAS